MQNLNDTEWPNAFHPTLDFDAPEISVEAEEQLRQGSPQTARLNPVGVLVIDLNELPERAALYLGLTRSVEHGVYSPAPPVPRPAP